MNELFRECVNASIMKVFKFGGASVNSADAVRNMARIVQKHLESEPLVVVVSAMGKTTNNLECLARNRFGSTVWSDCRQLVENYHRDIARKLMPHNERVQHTIGEHLAYIDQVCQNRPPDEDADEEVYAKVVTRGELLSTAIIDEYLNSLGIRSVLANAFDFIITDGSFREARVDWEKTLPAVQRMMRDSAGCDVVLTQGFIGSRGYHTNLPATLGREGSDYTAAILAYCLDAESVTIWKDVPGFLNADPKYFKDTVKIRQIPYNEAIELAYYGASVIHPKTVKPLQNKGIPLHIKSFLNPRLVGSVIGDYKNISPQTPLYIFRNNQILLSIYPRDFSFIAEDNLAFIFGRLNAHGIRVNLMQNSALSFSICVDNEEKRVKQVIADLTNKFQVRYNDNLQLVTIRFYTQEVIDSIVDGRPVLLEQRSRSTEQLVVPCR